MWWRLGILHWHWVPHIFAASYLNTTVQLNAAKTVSKPFTIVPYRDKFVEAKVANGCRGFFWSVKINQVPPECVPAVWWMACVKQLNRCCMPAMFVRQQTCLHSEQNEHAPHILLVTHQLPTPLLLGTHFLTSNSSYYTPENQRRLACDISHFGARTRFENIVEQLCQLLLHFEILHYCQICQINSVSRSRCTLPQHG
jgi:hypothetical protein